MNANAGKPGRPSVAYWLNDEPRILDTDLAEALGFEQPRDIRKLIRRHMSSLLAFGICTTAVQNSGQRGRPAQAFYLNKRQAMFITAKSETENATEFTIELVNRFDEYERGIRQPAKSQHVIPQTMAEALRLAAYNIERAEKAEADPLLKNPTHPRCDRTDRQQP